MMDESAVNEAVEIAAEVLPGYAGWEGAAVTRLGAGLINRSYLLSRADGARAVLQAVSPIFSPAIHGNIVAVTERLAAAGLVTPRLLPARDGRPYLIAPGGTVWRLQTHIDGVAFDVVGGAAQARAAGALVGRFHAAVDGLDHTVHRPARRRPRHAPPPGAARRGGRQPRRAPPGRRGPAARAGNPRRRRRPPPAPRAPPARLPRRSQVQQHPLRGDATARRRARGRAHRPRHRRAAAAGVRAGRRLAVVVQPRRRGRGERRARSPDHGRVARRLPRGPGTRAQRRRTPRPGARRRVGEPGAGRPLRRRRARRVVLRLERLPLPRPRRAQPGPRARPVVVAPGAASPRGPRAPRCSPPAELPGTSGAHEGSTFLRSGTDGGSIA